jgi:hypothetical protein
MIEGAEPPTDAVTLPGTQLIIRSSSGPAPHNGRRPKIVTEVTQILSPTTEHN